MFGEHANASQRQNSTGDIARRVTAQISALLARGVRPWANPLGPGYSTCALPKRANGVAYRGVNAVALWAVAASNAYPSEYWLTFRQAAALGAHVRKGERGTPIIYYEPASDARAPEVDQPATKENAAPTGRAILRAYTVFNAAQIEGLPMTAAAEKRADCFLSASGQTRKDAFARVPACIRVGGSRAYYSPSADVICIPEPAAFRDEGAYFATLAHELAHWTRHRSRLDRDFGQKRWGDEGYAVEELVAELAAAFVGAHLGLAADHLEDHAAYVATWQRVVEHQPNVFMMAAARAQAAADYLLAFMRGNAIEGPGCSEAAALVAQR